MQPKTTSDQNQLLQKTTQLNSSTKEEFAEYGFFDPNQEKDSCGIGLVTQINGVPSHSIVTDALQILKNLDHRGARASDPLTGDGSGILCQIPHLFFKKEALQKGFELPPDGDYAVATIFLPTKLDLYLELKDLINKIITNENLLILYWREVPINSSALGYTAKECEPLHRQIFIFKPKGLSELEFEQKLFITRRRIEKAIVAMGSEVTSTFAIPSCSSTKIVYKGLLIAENLDQYFLDLKDPLFASAIAMVHSRFSTNTFPTWPLAHPFRYLCHNGEINTLKGNVNWMKARQGRLLEAKAQILGTSIEELFPLIQENQSDSACLDNMLEFLVLTGRSLSHSAMMLVPEPWLKNPNMSKERRAFYEFHATMMEPWDGPAALVFTNGKQVGATLDRNGLRPCRYVVTSDGRLVLASEAGALGIPASQIIAKGRLEPGKMLFVDTVIGKLYNDEEIKSKSFKLEPYSQWLTENLVSLKDLPQVQGINSHLKGSELSLISKQKAFSYSEEEIKRILLPMAQTGEESLSSMGNDTPLAILSEQPQLLFKYFKQLFAQVTNPPIDPIRENLVMSLVTFLGSPADLWSKDFPSMVYIRLESPILTKVDFAKILQLNEPNFYRVEILEILFDSQSGQLLHALNDLCAKAEKLVREGTSILILSDLNISEKKAAIPSLLAISALHQHLINKSLRTGVSLIIETGEARDVHQMACLLGFGAEAIYPYLAFESIENFDSLGEKASLNYSNAIQKGLLKIFSKMGISTLQSYCGAQIFEALGLSTELTKAWFGGVPSRIGGLTLELLEQETLLRHHSAFNQKIERLELGGEIHFRNQGEAHFWNPETISSLQEATKNNSLSSYKQFTEAANEETHRLLTLRGLLEFNFNSAPVSIDEVESAKDIVKRFTTGAMSMGAISREAHETLAIAMNRIGAKSNTGEGGEDALRYRSTNSDSANSAIKQIASGRFGVTANYLVNARELQIKMAQGAKPGEGGQLPGHKVDEYIAMLRHSTPGVQLISPPPHHDIYSIEDLAQLILDLRHSNDKAEISVKLVSEVGIGAVAAGVAKAQADKIVISGDSGGTGASPISSIKHAGLPWELGLAEAHQTLLLNQLRSRVRLETDGQLRTGRDVAIAALLGADEFGFATAPLIVEGCLMMRKCHLNTCPVGIATQDPILRSKFKGRPEHVVNYFFFVAEELRDLMAQLGFRNLAEMVGRTDKLKKREVNLHWKAKTIDFSKILFRSQKISLQELTHRQKQKRPLDSLAYTLVDICRPALEKGKKVSLNYPIQNTDRSVGTLLSSRVVEKFGPLGLPEQQILLSFYGSAGQSFGAFLAPGITLELKGETNDYLGKGLSGGTILIYPEDDAAFNSESAILVGNTAFYGATSGKSFIAGRAGERFAVRNSGAMIVVEGVGDHGCEYMTGGIILVLGKTGRNFGAGMSGGFAYVLDEDQNFRSQCNHGMVELQTLDEGADEGLVLELIREHLERTGSSKARRMLSNWNHFKAKMIKVIPIEYKKALLRKVEATTCLN